MAVSDTKMVVLFSIQPALMTDAHLRNSKK